MKTIFTIKEPARIYLSNQNLTVKSPEADVLDQSTNNAKVYEIKPGHWPSG